MALQGNLHDFSALEILQLLGSQKKSGCLVLEWNTERALVWVTDGRIVSTRAHGMSKDDPLAAFLPYALPPGVSVLCASRPRHPYVDVLVARGALQIDLDGAALADDNAATVRAFWEQAAPARRPRRSGRSRAGPRGRVRTRAGS